VTKLPAGVEFPGIPLERKYRSAVAGLTARIKKIYDAIYDRFGQEGLDLIEEISTQYGREIAKRAAGRVRPNDVKSMASYLLYIFELVSYSSGLEVTEFSDDRVAIKVERCPYPLQRAEICRAHTTMEVTLVRSLCPKLDYRISRCIPAGDPYCEHIVCRMSDPLKSKI
jgi:hypothetical protein